MFYSQCFYHFLHIWAGLWRLCYILHRKTFLTGVRQGSYIYQQSWKSKNTLCYLYCVSSYNSIITVSYNTNMNLPSLRMFWSQTLHWRKALSQETNTVWRPPCCLHWSSVETLHRWLLSSWAHWWGHGPQIRRTDSLPESGKTNLITASHCLSHEAKCRGFRSTWTRKSIEQLFYLFIYWTLTHNPRVTNQSSNWSCTTEFACFCFLWQEVVLSCEVAWLPRVCHLCNLQHSKSSHFIGFADMWSEDSIQKNNMIVAFMHF